MLEDGIVDSFELITIVGDLEEAFDIEIDASYVVEQYFGNKDAILALMKMLLD
jgi:acyl carrier protein